MTVIETLTKRVLPVRPGMPRAFVLHNTGEQDLDKILKFYLSEDGYQPHYLIETHGAVRRIVTEDRIAYHAKIDPAEARLYRQGYGEWCEWKWQDGRPKHTGEEFTGYREWRETWRSKHESPLDLVTGASPNTTSIGIEIQNPTWPTKDLYTDEQYAALAELLTEVTSRRRIQLDRQHVLGHYDVSPMRRSTERGNWDPGALNWNRLWDAIPGRKR